MNGRLPISLVLAALVGGCADTDLKPEATSTTADGMMPGTTSGGPVGPPACPDNPDPECTTSAACGNGEICAACECVPQPEGCDDPGAANCIEDADCPESDVCSGCICIPKCPVEDPQECFVDADCMGSATCELNEINLCTCQGGSVCPEESDCVTDDDCDAGETCAACECSGGDDTTTGSPPLEGESDPVDDCTNDEGDAPCVPSMDLETLSLQCVGGDAVVRVAVDSGMVNDAPADYDTFQIFLTPTGGGESHWVRAFGQAGAYDCDYRIGAAYMPLGPGDVCELNAADGTFDFTLSAATSGTAFEEVTIESTLSTPYLYDGAGPFAFDCP